MTTIDVIGHIGYFYIALGVWLLSYKNKYGWMCRFVGEGIWIVLGITMQITSIWMWGILFMFLDTKGYYKWSNGEK